MGSLVKLDNEIIETMIFPLWGRAIYGEHYPDLLTDSKAKEILSNIDLNTSNIYPRFTEYFGLTFVNRARNLDLAVKKHLQEFPHSTIVNLGAGMDTGYFRINDPNIKWYDLDLPEAISLKGKFVDETENYKFIKGSALDLSSFSKIDFTIEKGIIFLAGGLFMYFQKSEVIILLEKLAEKFPGGKVIFDIGSERSLRISNKRSVKQGKTKWLWHLAVNNPDKEIPDWSGKFKLSSCYTYWKNIPKSNKYRFSTRLLMKFADVLKLAHFIELEFET